MLRTAPAPHTQQPHAAPDHLDNALGLATMMMMTTQNLLPHWPEIRRAGLLSFILRYGLARFAVIPGGSFTAWALLQRQPVMIPRLMGALLVFCVAGALWAVATWRSCERASRRPPEA